MKRSFNRNAALSFIESMYCPDSGAYRSAPGGRATLYGTVYMLFARYYLTQRLDVDDKTKHFISNAQDPDSGYFIGPELRNLKSGDSKRHDPTHLLLHLNCAVFPACIHFGIPIQYPAKFAHPFLDTNYLLKWLGKRDFHRAWLEGNNLLFIGQMLAYLRDYENIPAAQTALDCWFDWLDERIDPQTGLWGSDGSCSLLNAMAGGYHQLLVYYHEDHPLPYCPQLIDATLSLQNKYGGFSASSPTGACEDVDAADILVNAYKRCKHRPADIRASLSKLARLIVANQNSDGGFSYQPDVPQCHMGIPDTAAEANASTAFATWFRIHTLALISELIPNDKALDREPFFFSNNLSMGWHDNSGGEFTKISASDRLFEWSAQMRLITQHHIRRAKEHWWRLLKHFGR